MINKSSRSKVICPWSTNTTKQNLLFIVKTDVKGQGLLHLLWLKSFVTNAINREE